MVKRIVQSIAAAGWMTAGLYAQMPVSPLSGIWYEKAYGEQTVWLDVDGRCRFVRGGVTLFDRMHCRWNGRGEMMLTYHERQHKVYMKQDDTVLMMSRTPVLLSRYTAETLLEKCKTPLSFSSQYQAALLGEWEARDRSMRLSLLSKNRCRYSQESDPLLSGAQCTWSAGKKGATLVFVNPEKPGRNMVLFVQRTGDRLLVDKEKSNLLPRRAKMQLVQLQQEK